MIHFVSTAYNVLTLKNMLCILLCCHMPYEHGWDVEEDRFRLICHVVWGFVHVKMYAVIMTTSFIIHHIMGPTSDIINTEYLSHS